MFRSLGQPLDLNLHHIQPFQGFPPPVDFKGYPQLVANQKSCFKACRKQLLGLCRTDIPLIPVFLFFFSNPRQQKAAFDTQTGIKHTQPVGV